MNPNESILEPGQNTLLDLKLDELRRELTDMHAPDAMEATLRERFRKTQPVAAARPRLWWMPPLALAATIAITSWMIRGPMPDSQSLVALAPATTTIEGDPGPFLALQPLDRIAHATGTRVVATEFPRALLADWGLPVSPDRAGEPVRAEMLYSADGEPLAVRLLN
ncbi:MAG: hypothetical protein H7Y14_07995 [Burkholderiales bacterium]|nr:hypothetical protein [Burkholderiales bacterium]